MARKGLTIFILTILLTTLLASCGDRDEGTGNAFVDGSNFVEVLDTQMHFIQTGEGEPILFLHGNPTSSFLWRNVTAHVADLGRTIALDLVGHGKSGKPAIDYRFPTQLRYLEELIRVLDLRTITLVVHDWGSALGFAYATRHPENVKAIAFMEAMLGPFESPEDVSPLFAPFLVQFRDPVLGRKLLIEQNLFIEQLLPAGVLRRLTPEELAIYREPFLDPASREPIWRWPNELPIGGEPADNHAIFEGFAAYLRTSPVPKLWLYANPGILLTAADRPWILENLPNVMAVEIGAGLHYIQEDQPDAIGVALAQWIRALGRSNGDRR